jgi:hypothetical protein
MKRQWIQRFLVGTIASVGMALVTATTINAAPAELTAADPNSQINLRSTPSTSASSKGYGLPGDRVEVIRQVQAEDGYTWYFVQFNESKAEGWIRGDFVRLLDSPDQPDVPGDDNPSARFEQGFDAALKFGTTDGRNFQRYGSGYNPNPNRSLNPDLDKQYNSGYRAGYFYGFQTGYYGQSRQGIARQFYRGFDTGFTLGVREGRNFRQYSSGYNPNPVAPAGSARQYEAGYNAGYLQGFHNGYYNISR